MKLLLIEDDRNVAEMIATAFREEGHATTIQHTGEAGLSQLTLERPDAVVLDILLPKMNGIEVLRHIRENDPTLPVIIVSGFATPQQLDEARRLGVIEIISKPHILKHFTDALARAARGGGKAQGPFTG
jgi:DNA-binding response OmpR family regulator